MSIPMIEALGWTLIGSLWQGALIAVLFAIIWLIARRWTSAARYGLCAATLLLLAITPAVTFVLTVWPEASQTTLPANPVVSTLLGTLSSQTATAASDSDWRERCEAAFPSLCAIWLCGVLVLALRRTGGWIWLVRARRQWQPAPAPLMARLTSLAARAGVSRFVSLRVTLAGISPCVIGWLRPVILVPMATLAGTNPDDLEALLVHELAHIRRHDYFVNLLQMAVETVFFYHPFVWWVSRQMRIEREHCCDDLAVGISGDPARYARALVELAGRQAASEFAMAATGGSLASRIRRLLLNETPSNRPPAWGALLIAVGVVALVVAADNKPATVAQLAKPAALPAPSVPDKRSAFPEIREAAEQVEISEVPESPERPEAPEAPETAEPPSSDERGEWLEAMMHSGLRNLTIEQLIELRTHGVTPEMARAVVHENADATPSDVEELAIHGVTAEYVDAMHAAVGQAISLKDLVKMKIHGVDPEFATRVKRSGFPNVSVEQLIRMRIAGL